MRNDSHLLLFLSEDDNEVLVEQIRDLEVMPEFEQQWCNLVKANEPDCLLSEVNDFPYCWTMPIYDADIEEIVKIFRKVDWIHPQYATLYIRREQDDAGAIFYAAKKKIANKTKKKGNKDNDNG